MSDVTEDEAIDAGRAIVVVGMHRSGTSMVTRLLHRCGLTLGSPDDLMVPNESNLRGHFENNRFVEINDTLLSQLGGSWDSPPFLTEGWEHDPSLGRIADEARSLIESFAHLPHWGWKDPRTTLLIPFWRRLIPAVRFVICLRNPLEVARSLEARDHLALDQSLALWERYMLAAVRDTRGSECLYTSYEDYFSRTEEEVARLLRFCALPVPGEISQVEELVERDLKHHAIGFGEVLDADEIPSRVRLLYLGVRRLASVPAGASPSPSLPNSEIQRFFQLVEQLTDEPLVARHRSEISRLTEELDTAREQISQLQAQTARLQEQITQLQQERDEQAAQAGSLRSILVEQEAHLLDLVNTRSWRITAPMRKGFDLLADLGERLRTIRHRLTFEILDRGGSGHRAWGVTGNGVIGIDAADPDWQRHISDPAAERSFVVYVSSLGNYFFGEIRDLIAAGLSEAGVNASVRDEGDGFDPSADWHIVVAPHEFFHLGRGVNLWKSGCPPNLILVNTEQTTTKWFTLAYGCFPAARAIWDISHHAAGLIRRKRWPCEYLPLGFVDSLATFREIETLPETRGTCYLAPEVRQRGYLRSRLEDRPVDLIFIGGHTPRREKFFAGAAPVLAQYRSYLRLMDNSAPVIAGQTSDLDTSTVVGLEQRSKILLNIHRGSEKYFEWHRIVMHGIWQRALVISEPSSAAPPFRAGVDYIEAPLDEIPSRIDYYLGSAKGREDAQAVVDHAFRTLTEKCRLADVLRSLLLRLSVRGQASAAAEAHGIADGSVNP